MNMLGRKIPLKTARKGGYFFVMDQDGLITATLDLGAYATSAAPVLPTRTNWAAKAMDSIKRWYLNNQLGCCVISSLGHIIGVWTGNDLGTAVQATDAEINSLYRIWNPRGDNGCDIATVNRYWRDHGALIGGKLHKIDAFVSVDNTNWDLVRAAIALFGNIKLGIDLPGAWEQSNDVWDVTSSGIIGGHDVPAIDFVAEGGSEDGGIISTWGGLRRITKAAFTSKRYITEAYSAISVDWTNDDNVAPNGIDVATLKADLDAIANGQIPSVGPPEVPLDWLI